MIKCTKTLGLLIIFIIIDLIIMIISWEAVATSGFVGATTLGVLSTFLFILLAVILISKLYSYSNRVEINIGNQEGIPNVSEVVQENFRRLQSDVVINIIPHPERNILTDETAVELDSSTGLKK